MTGQLAREAAAVVEAGERIVVGQVLELALQVLALVDALELEDRAERPALPVV